MDCRPDDEKSRFLMVLVKLKLHSEFFIIEDLSAILKSVTFDMKQLKLWRKPSKK